MADARNLTYGIGFDTTDALGQIGDLESGLSRVDGLTDSIEMGAGACGDAFRQMGDDATGAADSAGSAARRMSDDFEDAGDEAREAFREIGRQSDSLGTGIIKSMGKAAKETGSVTKTIRSGFDGAFGYAQKKAKSFTDSAQEGFHGIVDAVTHPVQAIRGKFLGAIEDADRKLREVGDDSDKAGRDMDDMGDKGESAGNQIKEAISGAVGAFVGFEAIQAGIDMLKELGAAAVETAGAAETYARKFDASFEGTDAAEWADNFAEAAQRSENEVKSFMVSNKALLGEMGITGDAATQLSKIATSLSYDLGNAFAMDDTEALGVIQDYIGGNTAALEEYGIHIDDAALKTAALSMGIQGEIDDLDDATAAQVRMNALLGQSADMQKAATESTGGLNNGIKSLKGLANDFMVDVGNQFIPVIEQAFSTITDAWPVAEPMLMGFVSVLSDGLGQAIPIVAELGEALFPVLTDVLGTVFEAGMPLLGVFGDMAGTILPPLASIVGDLGGSLIPPLANILGSVLSIVEPLLPPVQTIAEALLPAIGETLGLVSPLLNAVAPVLGVIGDVLGTIADALAEVIGWASDGISSVVGFFTDLLGGAEDSQKAAQDSAAETMTATTETYDTMGSKASSTYADMADDAEDSWSRMSVAASAGASSIAASYDRIGRAAAGASTGGLTATGGVSMPSHADGTDNFEGGWTRINEEGGEVAFLPRGTAIIPADKSARLVESVENSTTNNSTSTATTFAPSIEVSVQVQGNADQDTADVIVQQVKQQVEAVCRKVYEEMRQQEYDLMTIKHAYA